MLRDHYFEELAGEERYPFELLRRAIADGAAECTLPVADDTSVRRIWDAVVMDHPELVRYPGLKCYAQVSGRGTVIPLEYLDADEALYARRLEGMVRAVEARLTPASSDYAVCKAIYDVIAGCVTYQSAVLEKYYRLDWENSSQLQAFAARHYSAFTPYGIVVHKKGVCQGIARLYKILCDRFGIECAWVKAASRQCGDRREGDHALNVVEVNGTRAFVDVTNGLRQEGLPIVRYDFFLCSSRVIGRQYTVLGEFGCEDERVSYFARNGLRFTNKTALRRYLAAYVSAPRRSEVRVHYDAPDMDDGELRSFCLKILQAHCREGRVAHGSARCGFFSAIIKYDREE